MRRSILLALVAALALALGLSSLAAAGQGGVETSAKRAHKKGKKKGKGCAKAKGKKKRGKRCKPSGALPLKPGMYEGKDGIGLNVTEGGKKAAIVFGTSHGGGPATCIPIPLELSDKTTVSTAKRFKAGGTKIPSFGGNGEIRWVIEVDPKLRYKLTVDSSFAFPDQDPCDKPGARFSGRLKKVG